ncbi:DUF2809 domain-containing protein [Inediibacterium massiliense]|uniref:ribosomal maturation YjgA family protein n=1 Tax=Inediibacterium massiliense TaxID=1658111 RepID=UPI0006B64554|nr:DUF2809 domain-containing protein [Inediibacterium massiliense]
MRRNRLIYGLLIIFTIILGVASRKYTSYLPVSIAPFVGDSLWALMVFFMMGYIFKDKSTYTIATYALIFSYLIEISQLYHAPWIDHIRSIKLFSLILGHGFLWSDLVCYGIGIIIGVTLEKIYK